MRRPRGSVMFAVRDLLGATLPVEAADVADDTEDLGVEFCGRFLLLRSRRPCHWPSVRSGWVLLACNVVRLRRLRESLVTVRCLATQNRSVRLTKEVQAARARLEPWRDTHAVKALDERLVGVGFGV
jgi:hypothetical protein